MSSRTAGWSSTTLLMLQAAARAVEESEFAMMRIQSDAPRGGDDEKTQLRYARVLAEWGDAGDHDAEVLWDTCCTEATGIPYDRARPAGRTACRARRAFACRR